MSGSLVRGCRAQLAYELVEVVGGLEVLVDAGETHISDGVEPFQALHHQRADLLGAEHEELRPGSEMGEGFDAVLLSPGPGTPQRAGATIPLVKLAASDEIPLLGVCLGHQAIGAAFGATVDRAPELLHGKTSQVIHDDDGVLAGLPDPFTATRYHSLTVLPETIPDELVVTGRTDTGIVMAMRHRDLPIHGVQFHPESVLTQGGHRMLANWLAVAGIKVDAGLVDALEQEMAAALG